MLASPTRSSLRDNPSSQLNERGGLSASVAVVAMVLLSLVSLLVIVSSCSSSPQIDAEFPPGDPTLGDNPVLGSEGPGEIPEIDGTNYGLLAILAVCLIAAGLLLVRVERWERRRSQIE